MHANLDTNLNNNLLVTHPPTFIPNCLQFNYYAECESFNLRTTFRYITVLPSGLGTRGIAPRTLPSPSRVAAVSSSIRQLGVVRDCEWMTVRGLGVPILTVQSAFSSSLIVVVVPAIATETPVDLFSFCVGKRREHEMKSSWTSFITLVAQKDHKTEI